MTDEQRENNDFQLSCPISIRDYPVVLSAHGGGGRLMNQLIQKMFVATFDNDTLSAGHDGAVLPSPKGRLAFTTDSYVVSPLFFPGGDIGSLAVHGTVNDLAMCGARPLCLSAGFILEEGLPMKDLWRIVHSMQQAATAAGVRVVTGDTKVVERGKGDGVFINTAGVGSVRDGIDISPAQVRPGDAIIISGDVGRHGIAIMAVREGLEFETAIKSDSAPLAAIVADLIENGVDVHCLRDLTRGGLGSALIEIAETARHHLHIREVDVPVGDQVRGACELLGLDPFFVANEGRFIAIVDKSSAAAAAELIRKHPAGAGARLIGAVESDQKPVVTMTSRIGTRRILDMFSGEQLPRIC
jgi:hydrogenase expression/formation protein HypE